MENHLKDLTKFLGITRVHWHSTYGLILAEIGFIILATAIFFTLSPFSKLVIYLIGCPIILIIWWYTNRLPKTKKGKLGFVVSISAGDEIERQKIKEDFVITLHELLRGGAAGRSFQLIQIPEHIAETIIDIESARTLRVKCRAHFLIFGRARLRVIAGKQHHILDLEGMVSHIPLSGDAKLALSKEFRELFPKRVQIATENDVISFTFTSEMINCVSRYIIGSAAACSGDLDYAEELYKDVSGLLENKDHSFPIYSKLKQRIPIRLGEIIFVRATLAYEYWIESHDPEKLDEMDKYLELIPPSPFLNDYNVLNLRAILLFLKGRDVRGAINILKKCKSASDGTWLYNMGFLYAYMGNLRKAIQCYNNALRRQLGPNIIPKIEEFMIWVLEQEPLKYQIYYCLGYINWKEKEDSIQALNDFRTFLSSGQETEFVKERELASKWILEIRAGLEH